jgi:hypothetical protein
MPFLKKSVFVFLVVLVWLYNTDKTYFEEVSRIPLSENELEQ